MKRAFAAAVLLVAACPAFAEGDDAPRGRRASRPNAPDWELAATAYWNALRAGDDYASAILAADRGALHLEARANYEALHAQSAFVGWTFSSGDAVRIEATPILGFVGGAAHGPIAGLEATVTAGRFDLYVEAEYVRGRGDASSSYTYTWSEAAYRPSEWLRLGGVAQHTRAYGGERETQRGAFVQLVRGRLTASLYWFNPGSSDEIVIASVGMTF